MNDTMTTELTKAAQQALKPHQIAQLVNKLRDIAREFHAHGCLRELISREVNRALTQRPAALQPVANNEATTQAQGDSSGDVQVDQGRIRNADSRVGSTVPELTQRPAAQEVDESSLFDAFQEGYWARSTYNDVEVSDLQEEWGRSSAKNRASLPAPQQATPTRATREAEQRARMQARLAARHEGKATADFDLPAQNDAPQQATPEPVGEVLSYKPLEHTAVIKWYPALNGVPPAGFNVGARLFTRPAPGVPEVDDLAQFIRQIDGKHSMGAGALAEHICDWLAAAQAKGAGHE